MTTYYTKVKNLHDELTGDFLGSEIAFITLTDNLITKIRFMLHHPKEFEMILHITSHFNSSYSIDIDEYKFIIENCIFYIKTKNGKFDFVINNSFIDSFKEIHWCFQNRPVTV